MATSALAAALLASVHAGQETRTESGYSLSVGALTRETVGELIAAVAPESTTWELLSPVAGQVTQMAAEHIAPATTWLSELTGELATAGFVPEDALPELTFMRYPALAGHVSPHRDRRGYVGLILVASLAGTAEFRIHRSRDENDVPECWLVAPGDMVVMAGAPWRESNRVDARPFHSVRACGRERISATIRFTREHSGW